MSNESNDDNKDNKWHFSGGYEVRLIEELSKFFNFTYDIINCDSDWGKQWSNSTWTGLIGKIASNVTNMHRMIKNDF